MPPKTRSPFVDLLADLARALDRLGVGWYLFGAQAALLYGSARLTADVDVTIALAGVSTETLTKSLSSAGFELRIDDPAFTRTTRVLPVVHAQSRIPADLVLAGPGLEELFLERAVRRKVGGVLIPVARIEDLIVMKVLAGRPKDRDDVIAMIRAGSETIDGALLRSTLTLLEQSLEQSDLSPLLDAWQKAARSGRRKATGRRRRRT